MDRGVEVHAFQFHKVRLKDILMLMSISQKDVSIP